MVAANSIQRMKLMERDEIVRRLNRLVGGSGKRRDKEITIYDVARYVGVNDWLMRSHRSGAEPINDEWQILYSRVFAMIDAGELVLQYLTDGKDARRNRKILVRVARPATPPKRESRPFIEFADEPRLKFE